ncbi:MAG: chemotaxis protein CheX [Chitinivibrionales bacterium]|nr:chemotaxis protein CheX [Chitinivibrionales bacterium]
MLKTRIMEQTALVISRIVGDAAFMFADELKTEARPQPGQWRAQGVALDFNGEVSGRFRLWVGPSLALQFAANMLGLEADDALSEIKKQDALKEMLNIIVGNFLTESFGPAASFAMGLPQTLSDDKLGPDCANVNAVWLAVEGSPVLCVVEMET